MIGLLVLSTASVAQLQSSPALPCDGIRLIEASTLDSPRAFTSLRQQGATLAMVRNAQGSRVQQQVPVTNVRPITGFARCRFIYTASQIDLACYVGATLAEGDSQAIAAKLMSVAENIGQCLTNPAMVRFTSEEGSTPSISFGAGARHAFWQISMVRVDDDPLRVQPEVIVLGPSQVMATLRPSPKLTAKAKKR